MAPATYADDNYRSVSDQGLLRELRELNMRSLDDALAAWLSCVPTDGGLFLRVTDPSSAQRLQPALQAWLNKGLPPKDKFRSRLHFPDRAVEGRSQVDLELDEALRSTLGLELSRHHGRGAANGTVALAFSSARQSDKDYHSLLCVAVNEGDRSLPTALMWKATDGRRLVVFGVFHPTCECRRT